MWEVEDRFHVRIGGNTYINCDAIVAYKGQSLFTLRRHDDNGYLGIYFEIYDAKGKHIASVKRNEIYYPDKDAYKIDGSEDRYVFSEVATGRVLCDIRKRKDAHPAELDVSVELYTPSGFLFNATPDQTNVGGIVLRGSTFSDCGVGIAIE
jgi:hypothetical protein